jgi:hypothetical protein
MKKLHYLSTLALCILFTIFSCKKTVDDSFQPDSLTTNTYLKANGTHLPLTVVTIAGDPIQTGLQDGAGKEARFYYPFGIDVTDDGTIYVADFDNHKIRKITPPNVVSTLTIPPASDGENFYFPEYVRVAKDGTINILTQSGIRRVWIIKPNGTIVTPLAPNPYGNVWAFYTGLQKDPFGDFFWFSQNYDKSSGTVTVPTSLKKFNIDANGRIGTDTFLPPRDSLALPERNTENYNISNFYCSYNGVKYIVINNNHIYKLTPSGVFTQIYRDLKFTHIFSLTASKDSRVLYIADNGTIKALVNGKLQFLVGPQKYDITAVDGVGSSAKVFALYMVLSKDEGTLYFSDHSTIRKLLLR